LIAKRLEETVAFKCEASVRKHLISKELRETFALKREVSEKAPLASARGKKELEEGESPFATPRRAPFEALGKLGEEAAGTASRRFIRDAKAALRRG
jgi:HEAT repeat protein